MYCNIFKIKPIFRLKRGYFGDRGWVRVGFLKWLWYQSEHVNQVKWIKRR